MASLSRGILLPGLRPLLRSPRPILSDLCAARSRLSTTSLRCRSAAEPVIKATRKSVPPKSVHVASNISPSRYAFVKSLATKPTPTLLYEAPSHFWFYFGCWTSGLSILAWTVLTAPTLVTQPAGIALWVGWVYGVTYLLLGAMGFYLLSKTPNIVKMIRVLPVRATTSGPVSLQMEVTVKRMVPLLQPKVLTTSLDNVALKTRFSLPSEYVPELKRQELSRQEKAKQAELRGFDMQHLLTMPFRRLWRALSSMFNGVRSAWTDMGFGAIKVDGKQYKVDVTQGFAHDGFKTLERLVSIGWK